MPIQQRTPIKIVVHHYQQTRAKKDAKELIDNNYEPTNKIYLNTRERETENQTKVI